LSNLLNPFISFPACGCPPACCIAGGWTEIGRTTLSSAGDCITVSCLPYHRQYQVLVNSIDTDIVRVRGRFNADSGCTYASRVSLLDATDTTFLSDCVFYLDTTGGRIDCSFSVFTVDNVNVCENIGISHFVSREAAGSGFAPERCEVVFKWQTDCVITSFTAHNPVACQEFAIGSEVVVLGSCNPDQCMNFWELLTTATASGCPTSLTTCVFTTKKYLYMQAYMSQSTTSTYHFRFGTTTLDTGCNYSYNHSRDGAQGANTDRCFLLLDISASAENLHGDFYISNVCGNEKTASGHSSHIVTAGAATPPQRTEFAYKWDITSGQIDVIGLFRSAGSGVLTQGYIKVWGHD